MKRFILLILVLFCLLGQAFGQQKKPGKNFIRGLQGKDSLSLTRVWLGSMIMPGYGQAYNRQYWKMPILYGGAGSLLYAGIKSNSKYKDSRFRLDEYRTQRNFYYAGAALLYLGSVIDAVANYDLKMQKGHISPTKAALYSGLLPGLGQAYNGDYWKIPIIYAGFTFLGYWYDLNSLQYKRYRTAYNAMTDNDDNTVSEFDGRLSADGVKRYRDNFRRDRDYAILYFCVGYAINVIDAFVFAHLSMFDVSENLALQMAPSVMPGNIQSGALSAPAVGLNLRLSLKK